jgi:hypothetical protein
VPLTTTISEPIPPAADTVQVQLKRVDVPRHEIVVRQLRERHWATLAAALAIIAASFLLRLHNSERIAIKWLNVDLPPLCGSRAIFDIACPGCGLTRSFVSLAAGDVHASLQFHRLGWLLAAAVVGQIPYRIFVLRELRFGIVQRVWPIWFGGTLTAALIVNWLVNTLAG